MAWAIFERWYRREYRFFQTQISVEFEKQEDAEKEKSKYKPQHEDGIILVRKLIKGTHVKPQTKRRRKAKPTRRNYRSRGRR